MKLIDVNAFVGGYPFRRVPHTGPSDLLAGMDRAGIDLAWVSHLPGIFWRDPTEGNAFLFDLAGRESRFAAVPAVHPGLAHWEEAVDQACDAGCPAVRCDPAFHALDPGGVAMRTLARACGERGIPLMLAIRLEDARQRHPNDVAAELNGAALRSLVRSHPAVRLIVTHADRGMMGEVHFGSTGEEACRISWDICWLWGPPEGHLEEAVKGMGAERFLFGTGQPLRIPESSVAKLELTDLDSESLTAIGSGNAESLHLPRQGHRS